LAKISAEDAADTSAINDERNRRGNAMKLVIERGELLRALGHVTSVVERRTTIPILSNVLLKASGRALQFKATDLEREVSDEASAEVSQPGAVTLPAHILHDIVRKLPDGSEVEIKRDPEKERLTITSGHSRFALQTLAPEDFPDLATGELTQKFELQAKDLKRLIDKTRFAISTEETRYYLNGIYLHTANRGKTPMLRAVATDGHRLAQAELESPKGAAGMPARVIPTSNDKDLKVSNAAFKSAVDRVSTIASERGRAVKLNINGHKLVLSVNNPEGGSATEEIGAEYDAAPLEIGFNARYLLDIAGQLESDTAHFRLADPGSPTVVRDGSDEGSLYVLMPMRV
jgi:DNA polymerase-3 subunit beta